LDNIQVLDEKNGKNLNKLNTKNATNILLSISILDIMSLNLIDNQKIYQMMI